MEFFNSKKFLVILLVLLVWAFVSGCTPDDYPDKQPPHETEKEMQDKITKDMEAMDLEQAQKDNPGPTDFVGIAEILGCMFAPNECPIEKRKEEQKLDR